MAVVSSINFLGARHIVDAEAEYRLAHLGRLIMEAKRTTTNLSIDLNVSYSLSITNRIAKDTYLLQALRSGAEVVDSWALVSREISIDLEWFKNNLRIDYSRAFVWMATEGIYKYNIYSDLHNNYMSFAFRDIADICRGENPVTSILKCLEKLRDLVDILVERSKEVVQYLEELQRQEKFSLYRYVFDHLAIQAVKPKLFDLDEAYFTALSTFDIFYEALKQLARLAHTYVPGTHNRAFEFFDLRFTEPSIVTLNL